MAYDFPQNPVNGQIFDGGTKVYVWNGYGWISSGTSSGTGGAAGAFVLKAGDTMTGDLILNRDPAVPLQAATKAYVDAKAIPGGAVGEALVKDAGNNPAWGAPIDGGTY